MCQAKDPVWLNRNKNKAPICCLQVTHLRPRDTYRLKVKPEERYSIQMEIKRKQE